MWWATAVVAAAPTAAELEAVLAEMRRHSDGFRDSAETIRGMWRLGGVLVAKVPPRPRRLPWRGGGFVAPGVLPALVASVCRRGRVDFVWVAPALRRRGIGSRLVATYKLPRASHVLPTATAFWRAAAPRLRSARGAPAERARRKDPLIAAAPRAQPLRGCGDEIR